MSSQKYDFNPHSREGSDSDGVTPFLELGDFNPHSREGSDLVAIHKASPCSNFNPHSREGSDLDAFEYTIERDIFQSTLPRRE